MLDAHRVHLGASVGVDMEWGWDGWVRIALEAWMRGAATVSWNPPHFHGELVAHGQVELEVFGFGGGMFADTRIGADVFNPFFLTGTLTVGLHLSRWLPPFSATLGLAWGDDSPHAMEQVASEFPLPLPLREVAIEHLRSTASWPLARAGGLLAPDYERGEGLRRLEEEGLDAAAVASPPPDAPVVPLDCRPHLTFARPIHDDAGVGTGGMPPAPEFERIGDPGEPDDNGDLPAGEGPLSVRHALAGLRLERWTPRDGEGRWVPVAATDGEEDGRQELPPLYGSWAPVPGMPDGDGTTVSQLKLWLWSRNPYDYLRLGGAGFGDWFDERFEDYPCPPIPDLPEECYDFAGVAPGPLPAEREPFGLQAWAHPENAELVFLWRSPVLGQVRVEQQPVEDHSRVAWFESGMVLARPAYLHTYVLLPSAPNGGVRLVGRARAEVLTAVWDARFVQHGLFRIPPGPAFTLEVPVDDVRGLILVSRMPFCLARVCLLHGIGLREQDRRRELADRVRLAVDVWRHEGHVLQPHTDYRLRIHTRIATRVHGLLATTNPPGHEQVEYAHFRTEGPPGLANLSVPATYGDAGEALRQSEAVLHDAEGQLLGVDGRPSDRPVLNCELNTLTPYVRQTVPPSVPRRDKPPELPRPVYRGYDVGVDFGEEDYVGPMYRMAQRDLGLFLYDDNGRPARDAAGRLLLPGPSWDRTEGVPQEIHDRLWTMRLIQASCAGIEEELLAGRDTLGFSMDREQLHRRLVRVCRGRHEVLAEDAFAYVPDREYVLAVEAVGRRLTVSLDGLTVFDVEDDGPARGGIGLYTHGALCARFGEVRVDDLRETSRPVYTFKFATSRYATFLHHLHSHQDEMWLVPAPDALPEVECDVAAPTGPPHLREIDSFGRLVTAGGLTTAVQRPLSGFEVTRVNVGDSARAFLLRSPEPLDWRRTTLRLLRLPSCAWDGAPPGAVKLTDVTFGRGRPNEESVSLLLRLGASLSGHSIEYAKLDGPIGRRETGSPLFEETFDGEAAGTLHVEPFDADALDRYATHTDMGEARQPEWRVADGHLLQVPWGDEIRGRWAAISRLERTLPPRVRIRATLRTETGHAIGLLFGRTSMGHHRLWFSGDPLRSCLEWRRGREWSVLWSDRERGVEVGRSHAVRIDVFDHTVVAYLDGQLLVAMETEWPTAGQVGFYCWQNDDAHFESLSVERLGSSPGRSSPTTSPGSGGRCGRCCTNPAWRGRRGGRQTRGCGWPGPWASPTSPGSGPASGPRRSSGVRGGSGPGCPCGSGRRWSGRQASSSGTPDRATTTG